MTASALSAYKQYFWELQQIIGLPCGEGVFKCGSKKCKVCDDVLVGSKILKVMLKTETPHKLIIPLTVIWLLVRHVRCN